MTISPFFHIPICIERTVISQSLTWDDWLEISSTSKKTREVVLSLKPFKIFVLGRLIIPRLCNYIDGDRSERVHRNIDIEMLRARTGDIEGAEMKLAELESQAKDIGATEFWPCIHIRFAYFLVSSGIENAYEKVLKIINTNIALGGYTCDRLTEILKIIKLVVTKEDEDSLEFAFKLAEIVRKDKRNGDHFYSKALFFISRAILKRNTTHAVHEAESLAKKAKSIFALQIRCEIARACSQNFMQLIRDYFKANESELKKISYMVEWRYRTEDADCLDDCIEISQLGDDFHFELCTSILFGHYEYKIKDLNELERIKFIIGAAYVARYKKPELCAKFLNGKEEAKIENIVRRTLMNTREKSVNYVISMIDSLEMKEGKRILFANMLRSSCFVGQLDFIRYAVHLDSELQYHIFSSLLRKYSNIKISGAIPAYSFIKDVHGILNSKNSSDPSYGRMVANVILSENQ